MDRRGSPPLYPQDWQLVLVVPRRLPEALRLYAEEIEKREMVEKQLAVVTPKAGFCAVGRQHGRYRYSWMLPASTVSGAAGIIPIKRVTQGHARRHTDYGGLIFGK